MAKDAERKRKLEQDQAEQSATPKRLKQTKGDSTKKSGAKTNGEASGSGSPMVLIPSNESTGKSKNTPNASGSGKKSAKKNRQSDEQSTADTTTPSKAQKSSETTTKAHDAPTEPNVDIATPTPGKQSKKKKKRKSQQQDGDSMVVDEADPEQNTSTAPEPPSVSGRSDVSKSKEQRALQKKERRVEKRMVNVGLAENEQLTAPNPHGWWLSGPGAGRYLDHDPIFVKDEDGRDCVIAATVREIQLLSLETSLIVRTHVVPDGRSIACYSISTSDPGCVDIAYENGTKVQWNWTTSALVKGTFPGQETTVAMTSVEMHDGRTELFYIARSQRDYTVVGERKSLYTTERRLKSIQVLHNGVYVVCVSATALILGARKDPETCEYVWVEIPVEMPILCAHARLQFADPSKKKSTHRPDLTVAVGNAEGQVHLYHSLSSVFASPANATLPSPRVLHWHREAVSAVKFSRDGNYLLTGGKETVLVLWQLETGHQQFLPHLGAEIERIVVSPDGTRYAMQMGDNSIMVLSTSELKPVANFAGLQMPMLNEELEAKGVILPETTAILHPKDPHQLLLSVPATQPKSMADVSSRPFLQSFDIRNARHISKQALTRNNITDFNRGPEKTPIVPPDVNLLAVSADGKWLASVDEWYPPATDLGHAVAKTTGLDNQELKDLQEQQERRREIYLKFWRWDETRQMWTLTTRVDAPHARSANADPGTGAGGIFKLVSDPSSNCFATVGEDSIVKVWKPKVQLKFGVPKQEEDGTDMLNWTCSRAIPLPTAAEAMTRADSPMELLDEITKDEVADAALVFSQDGSMLACGMTAADDNALPLVHFLSPTNGSLLYTKTGLIGAEQELLDFGFIDRYFVSLSAGSVRVWNLIDDAQHYTIMLAGRSEDQETAMLAINQFDQTFAVISYVPTEGSGTPTAKVEVYEPARPVCLFETEFTAQPAKILAGNGVKGFTILFEDGTIRSLSSNAPTVRPGRGLLATTPAPEESALTVAGAQDEDVEMVDNMATLALPAGEYSAESAGDDRPVVRPEQLASIFDVGNSLALPPVREMFQSVVELFGRKPHVQQLSADAMEVELA